MLRANVVLFVCMFGWHQDMPIWCVTFYITNIQTHFKILVISKNELVTQIWLFTWLLQVQVRTTWAWWRRPSTRGAVTRQKWSSDSTHSAPGSDPAFSGTHPERCGATRGVASRPEPLPLSHTAGEAICKITMPTVVSLASLWNSFHIQFF